MKATENELLSLYGAMGAASHMTELFLSGENYNSESADSIILLRGSSKGVIAPGQTGKSFDIVLVQLLAITRYLEQADRSLEAFSAMECLEYAKYISMNEEKPLDPPISIEDPKNITKKFVSQHRLVSSPVLRCLQLAIPVSNDPVMKILTKQSFDQKKEISDEIKQSIYKICAIFILEAYHSHPDDTLCQLFCGIFGFVITYVIRMYTKYFQNSKSTIDVAITAKDLVIRTFKELLAPYDTISSSMDIINDIFNSQTDSLEDAFGMEKYPTYIKEALPFINLLFFDKISPEDSQSRPMSTVIKKETNSWLNSYIYNYIKWLCENRKAKHLNDQFICNSAMLFSAGLVLTYPYLQNMSYNVKTLEQSIIQSFGRYDYRFCLVEKYLYYIKDSPQHIVPIDGKDYSLFTVKTVNRERKDKNDEKKEEFPKIILFEYMNLAFDNEEDKETSIKSTEKDE